MRRSIGLVLFLAGCTGTGVDPVAMTESAVAIEGVELTYYTLVSEDSTSGQHTGDTSVICNDLGLVGCYHKEFLCSGYGVAMQGTGQAANGSYVKYASGGGGWGKDSIWLADCSTARFSTVAGVTGASGRVLEADYSIAVDRTVIALGSSVWIDSEKHWFRADDTGGGITGNHIDIYEGATATRPSAGSSRVYVSSTAHGRNDPSPSSSSCGPTLERYPVNGAHNNGYDTNALTYSCTPNASSPSNSDFGPAHLGNDIFAARGTPVVAATSGTVRLGFSDPTGGNVVYIEDSCGWWYYYAHLDTVEVGADQIDKPIAAGTRIGTVGNTGSASVTSTHLHFSIYPGTYSSGIDPYPYLSAVEASACGGDPATCGSSCTQCVLGQRTDLLPVYAMNGWDTSCANRDSIVNDWCRIDAPACTGLRSGTCASPCGAGASCGSGCTQCVLAQRTDILPFYQAHGWDISCGNRDNVVTDWCRIDPQSCGAVKQGTCQATCGGGGGGGGGGGACGSGCTQCVLNVRPDILPFYQSNGWDTSCAKRDAVVTDWCKIDPAGCSGVKSQSCSATCGGGGGGGGCGSTCTQCVLGNRTDILPFYQMNGWDISCGNHDNVVANWCTIDPSGCAGVKGGTCSSSCR